MSFLKSHNQFLNQSINHYYCYLMVFIIWPAPRAGKMNQIARCNWLPERERWSHLARSGLPALSRMKHFPESHIINPLLTKFVRSRWLDIGLGFFASLWTSTSSRSINTQKKELGQYPAILTPHLVNNPYILCSSQVLCIGYCTPLLKCL